MDQTHLNLAVLHVKFINCKQRKYVHSGRNRIDGLKEILQKLKISKSTATQTKVALVSSLGEVLIQANKRRESNRGIGNY